MIGRERAARPFAAGVPALRRRHVVGGAIAVLAFAAAALAAVFTTGASGLNVAVEGLSSDSSGVLSDVSAALPLGFAYAAGMVSAVNPCGFSLLPAYLGIFLGERGGAGPASQRGRLLRGLKVGASVSLGFVLLFTAIGLIIGGGARLLVDALPWIGFLVGIALILAAGYRIAGGGLAPAAPERVGARIGDPSDQTLRGYFLFGLSYGTASLSCTLPIFLAVVGGSLTTARFFSTLSSLGLYALGMSSVILALTVAIALFKSAMTRALRKTMRYVEPLGTAALVLAGMYVVYYWLTVGELLG